MWLWLLLSKWIIELNFPFTLFLFVTDWSSALIFPAARTVIWLFFFLLFLYFPHPSLPSVLLFLKVLTLHAFLPL